MATYDDARRAVHSAAVEIIEDSKGLSPSNRAKILRDAALAVRYAAGGPQPGGHAE
ncbi:MULTISPECIES: hypothetical protein [Microbacterium]|uniref:hypothetical protein n=1 Tax=Microbacterium TaxID=33882 RepID=UPI001C2C9D40|nr:hypothetical protein [Microbacterium paraoxydans]QXE28931.1 hypothetical protein IZR02_11070 [Microbacterium paraoxydans]